ncbi:MAG: dienelactone hydrolase family protein [Planctomycetota bacterium]|nr:dienelactone hydrolase family protein [Planctomycetota bacterium]
MPLRSLARRAGVDGFVTFFHVLPGDAPRGAEWSAEGVRACAPLDLGLDFTLLPRKREADGGRIRVACVLRSEAPQRARLALGTFRGAAWRLGAQSGRSAPEGEALSIEQGVWDVDFATGKNVLEVEFEVEKASGLACVRLFGLTKELRVEVPEETASDPDAGAPPEFRMLNAAGALQFEPGGAHAAWAAKLRDWWERSLDLGAPAAPAVRVLRTEAHANFARHELLIAVPGGVETPATLLIPERLKGPAPAVLAAHGHGPGRGRVVGALQADGHRDYGVLLAERGYVVLAPDLRNFGERADPLAKAERYKRDPCDVQMIRGLAAGAWPAQSEAREWRAWLDVLAARPEVDPERLGVLGLSLGGRTTGLCAALDRRVKAAVVSGALNLMRERVQLGQGCVKYLLPGLLAQADLPELYALAAPRALFFELGADDGTSPEVFAQEAFRRMAAAYEAAGARSELEVHVFDGGHYFNSARALPWLDARLKPA